MSVCQGSAAPSRSRATAQGSGSASRELAVTAAELSGWREAFLAAGAETLAHRLPDRLQSLEVIDGRWLNNLVEQDHRRIKRRTGPMLGFQSFGTARRTLAGVEAMAMLAKGQVRAVPANDMPAQRALVHQVFGLAV